MKFLMIQCTICNEIHRLKYIRFYSQCSNVYFTRRSNKTAEVLTIKLLLLEIQNHASNFNFGNVHFFEINSPEDSLLNLMYFFTNCEMNYVGT